MMKGEIIDINSGVLSVKVFGDVNIPEIQKNAVNGHYFAYIEPYKKDDITDLQRKHYWALVGDIEEYTGYPSEAVDSWLKYHFMHHEGLDEFPSVARGMMKKETASKFLEYVITYCIQHEIPFRKQQFYLTTDISKINYALTMKRLCVACGSPHAHIHHHSNLVGMGNDRKQHNHEQSTFMALCWKCHSECHQIGLDNFARRYNVKAIKLTAEELQQLGVIKNGTKKNVQQESD